tara:strand:+ start:63 stop:875 length:813 start_codon:yes stop_codon:yes gene_type:complete
MHNILYTRVSTNGQGSESLQAQNQICLNYLNTKGLTINGSFQEVCSAYNGNQKVLNGIINNHKNCTIVVLNVTRFCRNVVNGLEMIKRAKNNRINIHFIEEGLDSSNNHHSHLIRVKLSESQLESETISNRINGINKILQDKGWKFGVPEYGKKSKLVDGTRKFLNSQTEKNIIDFIITARNGVSCRILNKKLKKIDPSFPVIHFYDDDGVTKINYFDKSQTLSFQEIADLLNDYGVTKRGKPWSSSTVNNVYNSFMHMGSNMANLSITV